MSVENNPKWLNIIEQSYFLVGMEQFGTTQNDNAEEGPY